MTRITVQYEDQQPQHFDFDDSKAVITLGRRSTNDVCIPDLSVSGNHAKITIANGTATLDDLNSTNGSYVNGEAISTIVITPGNDITVGKVQLGFECDSVKPSIPPANSIETAVDEDITPPSQGEDEHRQAGLHRREDDRNDDSAELALVDNDVVAANASLARSPAIKTAPETAPRTAPSPSPDMAEPNEADIASEPVATAKVAQDEVQPHPLDGIEHLVVPEAANSAGPMHELDSPSSPSKGAVIEIKNGAKSGQILPIDKPVTTLGRPGIQIAAIMRKPDGYFIMHIESDEKVEKPMLNSDTIGDEPMLLHSGDALKVAGIEVEFMLS